MSAVSMIVGRRSVGEDYLSVVRYVLSRLKGGRRAFLASDKESRRELLSHIIKTHRRNRNVYTQVTGGI